MSDIATETKAYVEMVDEAIKRIETLHGGMTGAMGDWHGLFNQALDALPTPTEIGDVIGQFDEELTNFTNSVPGALFEAIDTCSQEFGKLQNDAMLLQGLWQKGFDSVHGALEALAGHLQHLESDLSQAFTASLGQALNDSMQLLDGAIAPFMASCDQWCGALQGEQLSTFAAAWQHLSDNLAGQHTGSAQQFVESASAQAGQSFEQFVGSALDALSQLGDGLQTSLETLSTHLSGHISEAMQTAISHLIETGVHEMEMALTQALGVATIGEAITAALAGSGVLEIIIPLNMAIDAILRAIEIFKDPASVFGF